MSMPRCQPLRRRPNAELTLPSAGHTKALSASAKSGTASTKSIGARSPRARAGIGDACARRARQRAARERERAGGGGEESLGEAQRGAVVGALVGADAGR